MTARIGFIGAGKMAEALMAGLLAKGVCSKDDIIACAPSEGTRRHISETYGIGMFQTATEVVSRVDEVVLAVKPAQVRTVMVDEGAASAFRPGTILLSVVAGLTVNGLKSYVPDAKIVRVMPNHCVAVLEGAMGYTTDGTLTPEELDGVSSILGSVGLAVQVPEEKMDAITGLAGSSPAFIYQVIDAMADAGVLNGIPRKDAITLAAQSVLGAAKMVLETGRHPDQLKDEVCSPGGTTIEGVRAAEDMGLRSAMIAAVDAAVSKSREMSRRSAPEERLREAHDHPGTVGPYRSGVPVQVLLVGDGGVHHPDALLLRLPQLRVPLPLIGDEHDLVDAVHQRAGLLRAVHPVVVDLLRYASRLVLASRELVGRVVGDLGDVVPGHPLRLVGQHVLPRGVVQEPPVVLQRVGAEGVTPLVGMLEYPAPGVDEGRERGVVDEQIVLRPDRIP